MVAQAPHHLFLAGLLLTLVEVVGLVQRLAREALVAALMPVAQQLHLLQLQILAVVVVGAGRCQQTAAQAALAL
jgi:hypothetical protein